MQASSSIKNALNNYHFSDLNTLTARDGDTMKFEVSQKHGSGKELLIRVVDGLYVTYTDCCVNHGESANTDDYHGIICMYQIFDGEAQINFKNNSACFIKKNDIVNFAGNAEFDGTTVYRNNFVAAGLLCYYDELMLSFDALNLDTAILETYYRDVSLCNDVLVYNNDLQFSSIARQLEAAVLDDNMFLLKVKALEMLYYGLTNYSKYKDVAKRKYNRKHLEQLACAKAQIDENPQAPYLISELSEFCEISPTYFKKLFRECFGVQPHRYIIQRRLEKSKELLAQTDLGILYIAESLGFASSSRFSDTFKKEYGYLPSTYRREVKK